MKQHKKSNKAKQALSVAALLSLQAFSNLVHAQTPVTQKTENSKPRELPRDITGAKTNALRLAEQKMTLVALLKGEPVFKNGRGELFTMDVATGDIKSVANADYEKIGYGVKEGIYKINAPTDKNTSGTVVKPITIKWKDRLEGIKIIGPDIDGHLIMEAQTGEKFYLDPETGDMIDYLQHEYILKNKPLK